MYIYYYTPLPLNLANNKQQASKHVTVLFWPLHLPNASGLTPPWPSSSLGGGLIQSRF